MGRDARAGYRSEGRSRAGVLYHPAKLHPSILQAMRFPNGAAEYGTEAELFGALLRRDSEYAELPENLAAYATCFTLASSVPELLPIPLTLCVSGAPAHQIHKLFRLIVSWVGGLLVAELNRRLPFFLHPRWTEACREGDGFLGFGQPSRSASLPRDGASRYLSDRKIPRTLGARTRCIWCCRAPNRRPRVVD